MNTTNKAQFKLLIFAIAISTIFVACDSKNQQTPKPDPAVKGKVVTVADLTQKYFIVQKNVGKPLAVIYFVNDGGLKFYYDATSTRRIGTPLIENVDSVAGTAVAKIDLDGNGVDVFLFSLSKSTDGNISLTQTKYHEVTITLLSSNMYSTSDLASFNFDGFHLSQTLVTDNTYDYKYDFTLTSCTFYRSVNHDSPWTGTAPYYALAGNVGFKVDNNEPGFDPIFGVVWKKASGKLGFLVDNNAPFGVEELEQ